jgi:transglutaminase-like putative cysteine protease
MLTIRKTVAALAVFAMTATVAVSPPASADVIAEVVELVDAGQFAKARGRIEEARGGRSLSDAQRRALDFEQERMRRILLDFKLTEEQAMARVREAIPDLRREEFVAWDAAGLLEHQVIDGRKLYFGRAPSNLFRLSRQALARRSSPPQWSDSPLEAAHPHHLEVVEAAVRSGSRSVAPRRVRITQSIVVDADAVPAGQLVRAWIPYPRAIRGQQEDIKYVASDPGRHWIAPETTQQRTVFFVKPAVAGTPTAFSVTYELTILAHYQPIDPGKVVPAQIDASLAPHAGERAPHIVFTPQIRRFSADVLQGETNPYRVAQKLFAAVDRIPWAGAREYSTITSISDYALNAGHADCGQQTLLLMTLLRLNGIPARWQSGWMFSDGQYDNMHDWGWLYLAPYGWLPMDVTFGRLDSPDPRVAQFYLGGLDAYRVAFNDDYSQPFVPEKQHFRSETVDLQRGEVEWRGGNLYFDQWDYEFRAQVLPQGQ